eukprot:TRINITY_DN5583_c0_g2_i3.p1 TRINITY_DN5583_c0_g2~~TRINITY_DN5583_c0_g2_i3.p1  ORF type:complete len:150 (-),score=3.24 TRINITY_DN5583_c0_g2_i3:387-836(-)
MMEKGSPSKLRVIPNGDGKKRGVSVAAKIKQISGEAVTELLPRGPNCLFVKLNAGKSVAVSDVARSLWGERIVMRRVWRRALGSRVHVNPSWCRSLGRCNPWPVTHHRQFVQTQLSRRDTGANPLHHHFYPCGSTVACADPCWTLFPHI